MLGWRQKQNSWCLIAIFLWLLFVRVLWFACLFFINVWLASVTSYLFTRELLWDWSLALPLRRDHSVASVGLDLLWSIRTIGCYHNYHWALLFASSYIQSSRSFFQQIFVSVLIEFVILIQILILNSFCYLAGSLKLRISAGVCASSNICGRHRLRNSKSRPLLQSRVWLLYATFNLYSARLWSTHLLTLHQLLILPEWICILKDPFISRATLALTKCLLLLAASLTSLG